MVSSCFRPIELEFGCQHVGCDGWPIMCVIVAIKCCSAMRLMLWVSADWTSVWGVPKELSAASTMGCGVPKERPLVGNDGEGCCPSDGRGDPASGPCIGL